MADHRRSGPDARANEEMYHAVGFQVTEGNGYLASWTDWEDSPVVMFHL